MSSEKESRLQEQEDVSFVKSEQDEDAESQSRGDLTEKTKSGFNNSKSILSSQIDQSTRNNIFLNGTHSPASSDEENKPSELVRPTSYE